MFDAMRCLRRVPHGQEVLPGLVLGQHTAGLQRSGHNALHHIALVHDPVSLGKSPFQVSCTLPQAHGNIGPHGLMDDRGIVACRRLGIEDGHQWFIVHRHKRYGIPSAIRIVGHYDRKGLSDIAHFFVRQQRILRGLQHIHRARPSHGAGRDPLEHPHDIRSGEDSDHAR